MMQLALCKMDTLLQLCTLQHNARRHTLPPQGALADYDAALNCTDMPDMRRHLQLERTALARAAATRASNARRAVDSAAAVSATSYGSCIIEELPDDPEEGVRVRSPRQDRGQGMGGDVMGQVVSVHARMCTGVHRLLHIVVPRMLLGVLGCAGCNGQ
jgi:hypothetical protein